MSERGKRESSIWFAQDVGFSADRLPVIDSMSIRHTRVVAVADGSIFHSRPE